MAWVDFPRFQLSPKCGLGWLCPGVQGSRFAVRGSKFGVQYKLSEYNPPLPPRSGRSGGTLDIPWTYPGTIDPLQNPISKQASLSKSISGGPDAGQRCSGLAGRLMRQLEPGIRNHLLPSGGWPVARKHHFFSLPTHFHAANLTACGSHGQAIPRLRAKTHRSPLSCERNPDQWLPAPSALTNALRRAVTSRVNDTGPPPAGHGSPFIRTRNCRHGYGRRKSMTLRFLFR